MLSVPTLTHELLWLEPLGSEHVAGFAAAGAGAEEVATRLTELPTAEGAAAFVAASLERARTGTVWPFAQVTPDGRVVGHTAFLTPRYWPDSDRLLAIEIGSSYLHARARGTALNTVSKLLLMTHAFETWEVSRVDIKTDARNARARAGIEAVGARFEGILRSWQPSRAAGEEGRPRDTAMHAVVAADWPGVKAALAARIAAKQSAG